ncbi:RrF2 family transcriptional regulator [Acetobacter sp.]|uniref:RrF2 family transcriptional regulator n=1 Tax=Acetobacter sp. TaxID=440 RepID=UPI0039ED3C4D
MKRKRCDFVIVGPNKKGDGRWKLGRWHCAGPPWETADLMRLTLHTDYALRTLIFLACTRERLASIHEIATTYAISENHLVKIVHKLGQGGFIETCRGRKGGIRLAHAPETIQIGDVIRFTEGDEGIIACMKKDAGNDPKAVCRLMPDCQLRMVFMKATKAFFQVFDGISLADIVMDREQTARVLGVHKEKDGTRPGQSSPHSAPINVQ